MSLEKDIQQYEFHTEHHKAILNILYTHNFLVSKMADVFKDFDITRQQFNVLRILRGQYPRPASVNLIKERMLDKMSDTSRMVERLRLKGLIQRELGKSDKRSVEVTITQAGLDLLGRMEQPVNEMNSLLGNLSHAEAESLNQLLDKIRGNEKPVRNKGVQQHDLVKST